jgi:hypothetical protein
VGRPIDARASIWEPEPAQACAVIVNVLNKLEETGADTAMIIDGGARHRFTSPDVGDGGIESLQCDPQADARHQ